MNKSVYIATGPVGNEVTIASSLEEATGKLSGEMVSIKQFYDDSSFQGVVNHIEYDIRPIFINIKNLAVIGFEMGINNSDRCLASEHLLEHRSLIQAIQDKLDSAKEYLDVLHAYTQDNIDQEN